MILSVIAHPEHLSSGHMRNGFRTQPGIFNARGLTILKREACGFSIVFACKDSSQHLSKDIVSGP